MTDADVAPTAPETAGQLRALVDAYALALDGRRWDAAAELFTTDAVLVVRPPGDVEGARHEGRPAIRAVFANLVRYERTQHTLSTHRSWLAGDGAAVGESTCTAHHLSGEPGEKRDRSVPLRYDDRYAEVDGAWRIAHRAVTMFAEDLLPVPDDGW